MGKIQSWPPPVDLKSLEQFLGFAAYYSSFVQAFAHRAYPLSELRKNVRNKSLKFQWSSRCQKAFLDIKKSTVIRPDKGFPNI